MRFSFVGQVVPGDVLDAASAAMIDSAVLHVRGDAINVHYDTVTDVCDGGRNI